MYAIDRDNDEAELVVYANGVDATGGFDFAQNSTIINLSQPDYSALDGLSEEGYIDTDDGLPDGVTVMVSIDPSVTIDASVNTIKLGQDQNDSQVFLGVDASSPEFSIGVNQQV